MKEKYIWTIFVIAQYEDKFCIEFNELFNSAKYSKPNRSIRYIFLRFTQKDKSGGEVCEINFTSSRSKISTSKFEFKEKGIYNPETLISFFSFYISQGHSKRYMIIPWGHGAGLGFFPEIIATKIENFIKERNIQLDDNQRMELNDFVETTKLSTILQANLSLKSRESSSFLFDKFSDSARGLISTIFHGIDSEMPELISAEDFAYILKRSFKDQKIDLLINGNCYMQMLETGYALKDSVKMMIGSQTTFPFSGYHYKTLFSIINNNPLLGLDEIAENITNGFNKKYSSKKYLMWLYAISPDYLTNFGDFKEISFSANYLDQYGQLMLIINKIGFHLKQYLSARLPNETLYETVIISARESCLDLTPNYADSHGFIDFMQFFDSLILEIKNNLGEDEEYEMFSEMTNWYEDFRTAKNECISSIRHASRTRIYRNAKAIPQFLTIFFPFRKFYEKHKGIMDKFYNKKSRMLAQFQRYSDWDDCMRFFYQHFQPKP